MSKSKSNGERKIALRVHENPHRTGTKDAAKFRKLKPGMTLSAALASGLDRGYLRYSAKRGVIVFTPKKAAAC